jgi:hypothetical protein
MLAAAKTIKLFNHLFILEYYMNPRKNSKEPIWEHAFNLAFPNAQRQNYFIANRRYVIL